MQTKVSEPETTGAIDMTRFGAAIRGKRGVRSLREVAAELGMQGWSRLAAYERGEAQPGLAHFIRVCRWLDVPMEYFITTEPQDTQT